MPQTISAYTVMLPMFLRNRMLRHSTTFEIEHELVSFVLGYISEDFARTRVWSGSYFIFITNRGRLVKWQLPCSLVFPSFALDTVYMYNLRSFSL